ncbi:hypothetical protein HYU13_01265 [Candidatus Woesearchaeota archaeon]|nr:hypothetical protein [Candidatus Woesearchaeota archaeon]
MVEIDLTPGTLGTKIGSITQNHAFTSVPGEYLGSLKLSQADKDWVGWMINHKVIREERWKLSHNRWVALGSQPGVLTDVFSLKAADRVKWEGVSESGVELAIVDALLWNHSDSAHPYAYYELMNFGAERHPEKYTLAADGIQWSGPVYPDLLAEYCNDFRLTDRAKKVLGDVLFPKTG